MKYVALFFLSLQMACASVLSGTSQDVEINANLEGVDVYLGEQYLGKTPLTSSIPRQADQILVFRKNGYQAVKVALKTKMNPEFWWNAPFTVLGVTGMSTDYGCGAVYQLSPGKIYVKLKALDFNSKILPDDEDIEIFELFGNINLQNERARHQSGLWSKTSQFLKSLPE